MQITEYNTLTEAQKQNLRVEGFVRYPMQLFNPDDDRRYTGFRPEVLGSGIEWNKDLFSSAGRRRITIGTDYNVSKMLKHFHNLRDEIRAYLNRLTPDQCESLKQHWQVNANALGIPYSPNANSIISNFEDLLAGIDVAYGANIDSNFHGTIRGTTNQYNLPTTQFPGLVTIFQ